MRKEMKEVSLLNKFKNICNLASEIRFETLQKTLHLSRSDLYKKLHEWKKHLPFTFEKNTVRCNNFNAFMKAFKRHYPSDGKPLSEDFIEFKDEIIFINNGTLDLSGRDVVITDNLIREFVEIPDLRGLNLSNNNMTEIKDLGRYFHHPAMYGLDTLILKRNKITEMNGLKSMKHLKILVLGGNRITEIKNLENFVSLQGLDLSYNLISDIKGLEDLVSLKKFRIGGNPICRDRRLMNYLGGLDKKGFARNPQKFVELCQAEKKPVIQIPVAAYMKDYGEVNGSLKLTRRRLIFAQGQYSNYEDFVNRKTEVEDRKEFFIEDIAGAHLGDRKNILHVQMNDGEFKHFRLFDADKWVRKINSLIKRGR